MRDKSAPSLSPPDLEACLRVLRAIRADRGALAFLSPELRRELLMLAGLVAKPDRDELRAMAKAFRRADREARQQQDRTSIESAGLRVQRRSDSLVHNLAGMRDARWSNHVVVHIDVQLSVFDQRRQERRDVA